MHLDSLDDLPARYRTVLCDVWGVIHDGASLYPGVIARFERWQREGRRLVILTNAPRPADRVARELEWFGIDPSLWHAVTSAGQAGIEALTHPPRHVGFCGTQADFDDMEAHGVVFATGEEPHDEICLCGLDETRFDVSDYEAELHAWRQRDMLLHCLNPDRIVEHRGEMLVCAGALADAYEAIGGRVAWYGKPETPMFADALRLAGDPPLDEVVMVGDGPATDMVGAKRMGIDGVLVRAGVSGEGEVKWDAEIGDWRPILTVPGL